MYQLIKFAIWVYLAELIDRFGLYKETYLNSVPTNEIKTGKAFDENLYHRCIEARYFCNSIPKTDMEKYNQWQQFLHSK